MGNFKDFLVLNEAFIGYIFSDLILEARKDPSKLQDKEFSSNPSLFGKYNPEEKVEKWVSDKKNVCPITPLSAYDKHIKVIQNYASSSPENFAQVLMFSPLSANVSFAKHWDNFQALMLILKHYFPRKVTPKEIEQVVDVFGDKFHALAHSISGWKLDTVSEIWSNKEKLFNELNRLAATGDDIALINRLVQIKGVQPVKAGFVAQLLWGRAGCIDTHNLDIYSKTFPDLAKAGEFEPKSWVAKGGVEKYVKLLDDLKKRGIGTKQLWDVWVDFVETMYIMITSHGRGYYDFQGPALDPGEYEQFKDIKIPKKGIGKESEGVMVPLAKGKVGMGASSTHLPMDPDDALKQFYQKYRLGKEVSPAAEAVPFYKDVYGRRLDQMMGSEPTSLKYFEPALTGKNLEVDPKIVKNIIRNRIEAGKGKKSFVAKQNELQPSLF